MFKKSKDRSADTSVADDPAADPASQAPLSREHAAYEIGDFAGLDESQVAELRARAQADAAYGLPGCAHLVVTCDLRTGLVTHHVPCSTGLEALELAEQVVAGKRAEDPERAFTVTVTPLLPH